MSYNVYCFHDINGNASVQKKIMDKNKAVVVGMQELSTSRHINAVGQAALAAYHYKYMSAHKAFMGFASKEPLKNLRYRDFKTQDPQDITQYGQTRAYMMADLTISGKTVTLINAHLAFLTQAIKFRQMQELLDVAKTLKYVIIMGDFNCFITSPGDAEYIAMYQPFVQAGFHLANCADKITKTWTDKISPKSLSDFTYPTDNIITSPSIAIKKVYFDKIKLSHPTGDPMDHIPLVALVEIK